MRCFRLCSVAAASSELSADDVFRDSEKCEQSSSIVRFSRSSNRSLFSSFDTGAEEYLKVNQRTRRHKFNFVLDLCYHIVLKRLSSLGKPME